MNHNGNRKNQIYIEDVYMRYGEKTVLSKIDLSIAQGELCTLVGPSGCGKSTLLRIIVGEELPTSGEILIDGQQISVPDRRRGIVYQKYSLYPNMTVLNNVLLGMKLAGFIRCMGKKKELLSEAKYYLEKVGLAEHANKYPHELSGGMQQRVALAQTLITKPSILLMDEPFGALDPGTRENMQIFLLKLWEEFRMTVIFVTHDLEEAVYLGSRLIVLSQFYSDACNPDCVDKGARIVSDYPLPKEAISTRSKEKAAFGELIQRIRRNGFDPAYLQDVREFDLNHPDSFIT